MSIEDLIPINEALLLEKPKFHKLIKEFMSYTSYCGTMFIPEKMSEWCSYLQCDGTSCKNPIVEQLMKKPVLPIEIISHCSNNITQDPILDFNGSCFDLFFCTPISASKDYHYVLGIFGMLLATCSLVFSLIYLGGIPKEYGKKKTRTLMLIAQTICDILFLLFTMIASLSIYSYYSDLSDQLKLYSTIHIYLVLYILPFASMFEAMSIWILVLLIFDRYNYLSHGTHSKNILTKKICSIILGAIFISLGIFSSIKPLMYEMDKLPMNSNSYRLKYSTIGSTETFQTLIRFWLKMPFESLLPLTTVFIFITMIIHKFVFASSENSKRYSSYIDFQEYRLTKSILFISCLLLTAKVPKMAFHIMKYETGIAFDKEVKFHLFTEFIDQLYYWIKVCYLYPYMCPQFSNYLQNMLFFDKNRKIDELYKEKSYAIESDDDKDFLYDTNYKEFPSKTPTNAKETIV